MKYLLALAMLFLAAIVSYAQTSPDYYRFPNTYLFIQPPNDAFSSMDELVGLTTSDQSSYIRAENFVRAEEEMVDEFFLADFDAADFEEKEIPGGVLKYAWKKALTAIHPDSMFIYAAKVYVSEDVNYILLGYQKNLDEGAREQILHSITNLKVDLTQAIDPFEGKSFRLDLEKISLKYCEAFKSDWMVMLTADGTEFPAGEDRSTIVISARPYGGEVIEEQVKAKGMEVSKSEDWGAEPLKWQKYVLRQQGNEGLVVYEYYHKSGDKLYRVEAKIYAPSGISEAQVDEFVGAFELK